MTFHYSRSICRCSRDDAGTCERDMRKQSDFVVWEFETASDRLMSARRLVGAEAAPVVAAGPPTVLVQPGLWDV